MWRRILFFIACLVGYMASTSNFMGFNDYREEFIIGVLIIAFIDFTYSLVKKFKRYTLIETKYDILFRGINLIFGLICLWFIIKNWSLFFDFGWILMLFSFLGITSGIVYQNSIQLRKDKKRLTVNYKHRSEKTIETLEYISIIGDRITLKNYEKVIEINDIKQSDRSKMVIAQFFKDNYPEIRLIKE